MGSNETWLQAIIEAALNGQPLTLNVNLGPVTDAINTMNTALQAAISTSNSDLASLISSTHADSISVISSLSTLTSNSHSDLLSVISNLATTNSDLATQIASLATLKTAVDAVTAAVNSKNQSPILKASVANMSEILTGAIPAGTPVRLFAANANRIGFTIYNNSTNSLYLGPTNSPAGGRVFAQPASNAGPTALQAFLGPTVWTGEIWVLRNAGTGGVVGYELLP